MPIRSHVVNAITRARAISTRRRRSMSQTLLSLKALVDASRVGATTLKRVVTSMAADPVPGFPRLARGGEKEPIRRSGQPFMTAVQIAGARRQVYQNGSDTIGPNCRLGSPARNSKGALCPSFFHELVAGLSGACSGIGRLAIGRRLPAHERGQQNRHRRRQADLGLLPGARVRGPSVGHHSAFSREPGNLLHAAAERGWERYGMRATTRASRLHHRVRAGPK